MASTGAVSHIQSAYTAFSTNLEKGTHAVLKSLDIPQFPVEGAIFGQGHWQRCEIEQEHKTIDLTITTHEKLNFFSSWKLWWDIHRLGVGIEKISPNPGAPALRDGEIAYRLSITQGQTFDEIFEKIQGLASVRKIAPQGEEKRVWLTIRNAILDTSTNTLYEGFGNISITLRIKGLGIAAVTPIYAFLTIAYNLARLVLVNIYLIGYIFYEYSRNSENQTFKQITQAKLGIMGEQTWHSIRNCLRTPFFAIGFFFSALYMFIDPYNGLKMAGSFEHHWNHCIVLDKAWWFIPMKNFRFEGGGKPENLGQSTFYLAGCLAPRARTIHKGGTWHIANLSTNHIKLDQRIGLRTREFFLFLFPFCFS